MGKASRESSKQGRRRSKRLQSGALAAAPEQRNEGIRISENNSTPSSGNEQNRIPEDGSNPLRASSITREEPNNPLITSGEEHAPHSEEEQRPKKKTRGKTKMKALNSRKQLEVEFNEGGQPIANESVSLSSYLGPLVREMSPKQGKRSKTLRLLASAAAQQQRNEGIRISENSSNPSLGNKRNRIPEDGSNLLRTSSITRKEPNHPLITSAEEHGSRSEEEERPKKKTRGKTKLKALNSGKQLEVEFNDRGQPISNESVSLSSYLGPLVREMVPITINDWRYVNEGIKQDLWACVKARFKIDDEYENDCIKAMGVRWREHKSRVITDLKKALKSHDVASTYAELKPDSLTFQEWHNFIKEKFSAEFEEKSKKFKEIRAKNILPHTMSRKGYARLEAEMKKKSPIPQAIQRDDVWCKGHTKRNGKPTNAIADDCIRKIREYRASQSSTGTGTLSLKDDGVAHVLGPERNGRVRGLGFGVTPSKIGALVHSSRKVAALENKVSSLEGKVEELQRLILHNALLRISDDSENSASPQRLTPQQSHNGRRANVRRKCKLLNFQKKVVAEASLASTDPCALVHHIPLGPDAWKVWVDVALNPKASLMRPTSELSTIENAVGTTVAWPKDFISFC